MTVYRKRLRIKKKWWQNGHKVLNLELNAALCWELDYRGGRK